MKVQTVLLLLIFSLLKLYSQVYTCKQSHQNIYKYSNINSQEAFVENTASDTIDILNYTINLDISDVSSGKISGNCEITFRATKDSVSNINLDLLKLNVDSILYQKQQLTYSYNDTLLQINFPALLNKNDTASITVYYYGNPQKDASGWGGFYFQSGYAFNLGVGFDANPHNYGRVWFPCFDNFVERSTYNFNIKTDSSYKAFCNGVLDTTLAEGSYITWKWEIQEEIPTYLASVAVSEYETIQQKYIGVEDTIPVVLAAKSSDTANLISSFTNLNEALHAFEVSYGPYQWSRVGYVLIPFSSGAMEHATNISYPKLAANGGLNYESLMAHELSHHWWGNLVTCETAEDMWINEGMATYSEFLFMEHLYGSDSYKEMVEENHEYVIHNLHHNEGGFLAISGVPHSLTYSDHTYLKGADVAHTLRGYLGDSLFFEGLSAFLKNNKFTDVNSQKMRDSLSLYVGTDLSYFFDNWVFNGGFPHFSIDSFLVSDKGGLYETTIYVKQKLKGANDYFTNVPIEVLAYDNNWNKETKTIQVTGKTDSITVNFSFEPTCLLLDPDDKISDAITSHTEIISSAGMYDFNTAMIDIEVHGLTDSALIRVEHNWVYPDSVNLNIPYLNRLSNDRYFKISGLTPSNFSASAEFYYNGKTSTSGYLDNTLLDNNEDSIILMYRSSASHEWEEFNYYTVNNLGLNTDEYGKIRIDSLYLGEYTLGIGESTLGLKRLKNTINKYQLAIFPNPVYSDLFAVQIPNKLLDIKHLNINIYNYLGVNIESKSLINNGDDIIINTDKMPQGNYWISLSSDKYSFENKLLIIRP